MLISLDQPHCSPAAGIALVREIEVVRPPWSAGLSEIEILGENDFRVHTTSLPFPLLIRAGTLEQKTRLLEELLPQLAGRYGNLAAVDLRFNRRIIVKPLSPAGGGRRPARPVPQRPAKPGTDNREAAANAQRG